MSDYYKNTTATNGCMDWDDALENDGQEHIVLPEGDYVFEVVEFERGRYPGGAKIPACNKASLTLQVKTENGTARIKTDLILHRSLEWKISSFFRAIGQKQKGERLVMNWNTVIGSRGRAHIKPRNYTDRDGNDRTTNDVDRYLDFDPGKMPGMTADGFMELDGTDDELPFD